MVEMPRTETFQIKSEAATAPAMPSSAPPAPTGPALTRPRRSIAKRTAIAVVLLASTAAAVHFGYEYVTVGQYLQSTDDAYVKADYTIVAPKVSGYIADVLVKDNQPVKAGQVLARIDDRDFRATLAGANADVTAAEAAIHNIGAQITQQDPVIEQANAAIASALAAQTFAEADASRYQQLAKTGAATVQRAEQTEAARAEAVAQMQHSRAALAEAQEKIKVLATARAQAEAQLLHAKAVAQQAELNLSYTVVTAPVDGTVGASSLRIGQFVTAGTQLMAVVPLNAAYVVGNFKETQLTYVRPGQAVTIEVDGFSGVPVKGHVESVSPASGLEFALLPPDNATGNFTKIVQRIPVRIALDDSSLTGLLRAGMSVEPTIDTKAEAVAEAVRNRPADHLAASN